MAAWLRREAISKWLRPLVELDQCAPGIFDERQLGAVRARYDLSFEWNACGLELLGECDEVLHVEADMIEVATLGRDGGFVAVRESQVGARNIGGLVAPGLAWLGPEVLGVPRLHLGDRALGHVEVHVVVPDRDRLALVLQDLDLQAFARHDPGLVGAALVAGRHRDAGGLPFGDRLGPIWDDEASVITQRALGAAGRPQRAPPLMSQYPYPLP